MTLWNIDPFFLYPFSISNDAIQAHKYNQQRDSFFTSLLILKKKFDITGCLWGEPTVTGGFMNN